METTKFTKGEWHIAGYGGEHDESGASVKCGDDFICHTASVRNKNWDEYYSNAKLIATAPELLNALQEFLKVINRTPAALDHYGTVIEMAELAIKKATA